MSNKKDLEIIKTKWGFFQYSPLPSDDILEQYYADKYYQQGKGSYSVSYEDEELNFFKLKASLLSRKVFQLLQARPNSNMKMLDVGCGEGWLLSEFHKSGIQVVGLDFSIHGIEKFNPDLVPSFEQGNIYKLLSEKVNSKETFDIITLANVVEHVTDPVQLLLEIKKILSDSGILVITVPNDFSHLHKILLDKEFISKEWWLAYPDHLSYFNKENMGSLLNDLGFEIKSIVADNPIDLNLFNENSNYIKDPEKGRSTHLLRVRSDNFLGNLDPDGLLKIYEILGGMGVGRDLSFYCSLKT
ncbi:MAG: class I SAM-dependent methyltransferase [Desulfotalea sp.]